MHATSIGLAILAFQDPERTERFLARGKFERFTRETLTDERELRKEIALVRERGYAIAIGTNALGVSAVAAPILEGSGRAVAAINISAPTPRFDAMQRKFTSALLRTTQVVGRQLAGGAHRPITARKPA